MKLSSRFSVLMVMLAVGLMFSINNQAYGMPNFARRYNMSCNGCHMPVPRLNEFGYQFRAAGYRMPDGIGKEETSKDMGDYFAARTQVRYDRQESKAALTGVKTNKSEQTLHEITIYPITGAYAKNYSSMIEMSVAPEGDGTTSAVEMENAYVRYNDLVSGSGEDHYSFRVGVFHPWEGYGAADRGLTNLTRPYFQSNAANYNGTTSFKLWADQAGAEVGYTAGKSSIRATVFNGYTGGKAGVGNSGPVKSVAVAGGSSQLKDIQLLAQQVLTDNGGAVGVLYYDGRSYQTTAANTFKDKFKRTALFASYPMDKFLALGGWESGKDNFWDTGTNNANGTFKNRGYFAELDYNAYDPLWLGVRIDRFDPSRKTSTNDIKGTTYMANYSFDNGFQLVSQFEDKKTEKGTGGGEQKDRNFQLRGIFLW